MDTIEKLLVAGKAHALVLDVYEIVERFPPHERFELSSQLRRAAVSTTSNIVEGRAVGSPGSFVRHLRIAQGSNAEVAYQLRLARDLGYLDNRRFEELRSTAHEVNGMLIGLIRSIKKGRAAGG
jgi:four helix bundle protein